MQKFNKSNYPSNSNYIFRTQLLYTLAKQNKCSLCVAKRHSSPVRNVSAVVSDDEVEPLENASLVVTAQTTSRTNRQSQPVYKWNLKFTGEDKKVYVIFLNVLRSCAEYPKQTCLHLLLIFSKGKSYCGIDPLHVDAQLGRI